MYINENMILVKYTYSNLIMLKTETIYGLGEEKKV